MTEIFIRVTTQGIIMSRLGYACINMTLGGPDVKPKRMRVTTNRSCILATARRDGLPYIAQLAYHNVIDLEKIIHWNHNQGITLFRLSSDIFPFMSHPEFNYKISDLDKIMADLVSPPSRNITQVLQDIGKFVLANNHRLSTHPGPYNVLASSNPEVITKTCLDLDAHAHIFDTMGLPADHNTKINIHVGGAYGEPDAALARFCANFSKLGATTQARLTVENDDRANLYSVQDLYDGVHKVIGIPIVFDYHHHQFNTGGLTEQQALELAMSTWPSHIVPTVHYSESREVHDNSGDPTPAHSYLINEVPDTYGHTVDIMVEAKGKELAILTHMGLEDIRVTA